MFQFLLHLIDIVLQLTIYGQILLYEVKIRNRIDNLKKKNVCINALVQKYTVQNKNDKFQIRFEINQQINNLKKSHKNMEGKTNWLLKI